MIEIASVWFHSKWGIPQEAYLASMKESIDNNSAVPQWYLALDGEKIVAGLGVIENDFHNRKDLSPNVCGVYVAEEYRNKGIAGEMLNYVCNDFHEKGIDTLYLITNHTSFYEKYGWEFFCTAQGDGEDFLSRIYIHKYE